MASKTKNVKRPENMQHTGAYKIRGAYYKISTLSDEERNKGLITASAGNHAQGVAYAAKEYGCKAVIVMPTATPLIKVNHTKEYGAEVVLYGNDYDEACAHAIELAKEKQVAITCATAKETFAYVENNYIKHVIKRENSFIAKAPQTFNLDLIKSAHHKAIAENKFSFIDSCMIVKHYYPELDFPIVLCGPENIKITTQEDFYLAKAMFSIEEDEQLYRGSE